VGSTDYRGLDLFGVDSGDIMHFEWRDASRCAGFGVGGFGIGGFGRFTTDTTSHQWEIVITGSGGNVVQSLVVNTWAYGYTRSANVADNGDFYGEVAIRVWPFNDAGSATRFTVRTMDIFER
jgi:hypothetical protein